MILIGDYHLSLAAVLLGVANTLMLVVVIWRQKRSGVFNDGKTVHIRPEEGARITVEKANGKINVLVNHITDLQEDLYD